MSRSTRLLVVAFTLVTLLGAPLASEAAPRGTGRSFSWLWSFLAQAWEKEGCRIDPDGLCAPEAPVNTKEGCSLDPFGRCATTPQPVVENGCHIDPFGICISGN
ncbi:MAG TPA: hypothetical protein VLQ45_08305 [Thermoanaerobaculia bacterium]|nr:hypothetical protein [Thermoanaerobaculia bacterium]